MPSGAELLEQKLDELLRQIEKCLFEYRLLETSYAQALEEIRQLKAGPTTKKPRA